MARYQNQCIPRDGPDTREIWELKERSSLFYHMTIFKTRGKRPARKVKDSKEGGQGNSKLDDWTMAVREPKSYSETKPFFSPFEFLAGIWRWLCWMMVRASSLLTFHKYETETLSTQASSNEQTIICTILFIHPLISSSRLHFAIPFYPACGVDSHAQFLCETIGQPNSRVQLKRLMHGSAHFASQNFGMWTCIGFLRICKGS